MSDKNINDGGPTFPLPVDDDRYCRGRFESGYGGMTLRDWFVGRVCSALMTMTSADTDFPNLDYQRHPDVLQYAERIAHISYQIADAMLKERESVADTPAEGESECNYPVKYYQRGGVTYAVHGTSSINYVERLLAEIANLTTLATQPAEQHPDDAAVDRFAAAMKTKLKKKRQEGRGGWQSMTAEQLSALLHEHVRKGDPIDVANLAMMLHQNGQEIEPPEQPAAVDEAIVERAVAAAMSAPVGISMKSYIRIVLEAALASEQPAKQHPASTHCDNCGCDWLDNGLNPVGCPYCKQNAWREAFIAERATRYREKGMTIEEARIHAETDAALIGKQYPNEEAPDNDRRRENRD